MNTSQLRRLAPGMGLLVLFGGGVALAGWSPPLKLANAGDSISQGFGANAMPWDHTYIFGASDINGVDCFHPNTGGQAKLACTAWATHPDGSGNVADCLE